MFQVVWQGTNERMRSITGWSATVGLALSLFLGTGLFSVARAEDSSDKKAEFVTLPDVVVEPSAKPATEPAAPAPTQTEASVVPQWHAPSPDGPRRTFEQILDLPDDQFDIAEAVLALSAETPNGLSSQAQATALKELDRVAAQAKVALPHNPDGIDYCDTLYDVVLNRHAAQPYREDRAEDYDLSFTLQKKRGSCLSVGIMTLAVARRMGAPIWGAQCPGHFLLRYVPPAQNDHHDEPLNFDVTRPTSKDWKELDDNFYRRWHHIEKDSAQGLYLRPLTDREVVGVFLASKSGFQALKGSYPEALASAHRALALNSRDPIACINAGYALEAMDRLEAARAMYQQALTIDPGLLRAMNNMAYLKVRAPQSPVYDLAGARVLINSALKRAPDMTYLLVTQAEVKAAGGDWREATRCMLDVIHRDNSNKYYHERLLFFRSQLLAAEGH